MRRYLRSRSGSMFFFTVVTHERRAILTSDLGRRCLRTVLTEVRNKHLLRNVAMVLLPDHLHAVWELPHGNADYSTRWRLIKRRFTQLWCEPAGTEGVVNASRQAKGERGIWQRRVYEHTCRDEQDLERCINYVHDNPLKHGLVHRVRDWPWTSFHRYVHAGIDDRNWGSSSGWYGNEFRDAE